MRTTIGFLGLVLLASAAQAQDFVIRHIETAFDLVGIMTASCVQTFDSHFKPEARGKLHFSNTEIATYCVCSTKLLFQKMTESDFVNFETSKELPTNLYEPLRMAHFECARKVWDKKHGH